MRGKGVLVGQSVDVLRQAVSTVQFGHLEGLEERRLFALTVTPFDPASATSSLVSALVKSNTGITVTSVSYVGQNGQGGTYQGLDVSDGTTSLKLDNGIILTSGLAANAKGPNNSTGASKSWGSVGDTDLDALIAPVKSRDANALILNFTTTAATKSVFFNFVFGSEEFPEFVGSYNDSFGAYLDGKQISLDADNKPITVNNNFFRLNNSGNTTDVDTQGKTVVNFDLQYDGLTPALSTKATLDKSVTTHTLKFVIADAADTSLDSGVFIAGLAGDDTTGGNTGQPPVAKAGGPYTVNQGSTVVLDGSKSTDPNQTSASLVYTWDLDGDGLFGETGANALYGNETGAKPTFNAGALAGGTVKNVTLRVADNTNLVDTETTTVTVKVVAPVVIAKAGGPYTINEGSGLALDGSTSTAPAGSNYSWDVDGDGTFGDATGVKPTLSWTQLKSLGIIDGNATSTYQAKLKVTSGGTSKISSATPVTIKNVAPLANAGPNKSVNTSTAVTLAGTFSDPGDADSHTFLWTIKNASNQTVATGTSKNITFTPTAAGTYTASFRVNDDDGGSNTDTALVNAQTIITVVADAGKAYVIKEGASLTLDGSESQAPAGATYTWDVNGDGTFGDATGVSPTLTWTQLKTLGIVDGNASALYNVKVKVSAAGQTVTSAATTLKVDNVAPTVSAGADKTVDVNTPVTLTGTFTDPGDADTHTTSWVIRNGSNNIVATGSGKSIGYTPTASGTYTATFTVTDDDGAKNSDSLVLTVNQVVTNGPSVGSFSLVDADTNKVLLTLTEGMTLDLSKLPRRLNILANCTPKYVGSVVIGLDNTSRIERAYPYGVFSDVNTDFFSGTLGKGQHTIYATAYTGPIATGTPGAKKSLTFNVINQPPTPSTAATHIVLYNTATGQDIKVLKSTDYINLAKLPDTLGLRVTTTGNPDTVELVLDANRNATAAQALKVGRHILTALPFSSTGVQGASTQVQIYVTNKA